MRSSSASTRRRQRRSRIRDHSHRDANQASTTSNAASSHQPGAGGHHEGGGGRWMSRSAGPCTLAGTALHKLAPHQRAAAGIGWVPQERNIFKSLTVHENLTAVTRAGRWTPARAYEMFPRLAERKGNLGTQLSGGEQQMLAVARILRTGARLLLLDEISEGLAPVIVQALARMITMLRAKGYTVVMVEQNFRFAAPLADRFYVMEHGSIVESFGAPELQAKMPVLNELLGV